VIRIIAKSDRAGREELMNQLVGRSIGVDAELLTQVSSIIADVRKRGDAALIDYALRFDKVRLDVSELRVSLETLRQTASSASDQVLSALRQAISNVRTFHERQREESWNLVTDQQSSLGQRITPIEAVGLYVPGGTAAYPSSVIMNVVPAQVAGVERIVVTTPPETVRKNPAVAAALLELGVEEIYAVGGAQAIAALAFGTETIRRVDKVTGPGNKYVAAAKKLVFGVVGIDSIAGPSEVVIVADDSARADFVAADLLAQAEHGEDASSILITTSERLVEAVVGELEKQTIALPRRAIAEESLKCFGALLLVDDLDEAVGIVNELAPEHVELLTTKNDELVTKIKHAGAIFIGEYSPEAVGDYFAGPNHVLPTGRTARFSSALGVHDFVKRTSLISYSREQMQSVAQVIATLAEAEGLQAHANSALIRTNEQ
jgi:histidinol dehydrogenase